MGRTPSRYARDNPDGNPDRARPATSGPSSASRPWCSRGRRRTSAEPGRTGDWWRDHRNERDDRVTRTPGRPGHDGCLTARSTIRSASGFALHLAGCLHRSADRRAHPFLVFAESEFVQLKADAGASWEIVPRTSVAAPRHTDRGGAQRRTSELRRTSSPVPSDQTAPLALAFECRLDGADPRRTGSSAPPVRPDVDFLSSARTAHVRGAGPRRRRARRRTSTRALRSTPGRRWSAPPSRSDGTARHPGIRTDVDPPSSPHFAAIDGTTPQEALTFDCAVDGGASAPCDSPDCMMQGLGVREPHAPRSSSSTCAATPTPPRRPRTDVVDALTTTYLPTTAPLPSPPGRDARVRRRPDRGDVRVHDRRRAALRPRRARRRSRTRASPTPHTCEVRSTKRRPDREPARPITLDRRRRRGHHGTQTTPRHRGPVTPRPVEAGRFAFASTTWLIVALLARRRDCLHASRRSRLAASPTACIRSRSVLSTSAATRTRHPRCSPGSSTCRRSSRSSATRRRSPRARPPRSGSSPARRSPGTSAGSTASRPRATPR